MSDNVCSSYRVTLTIEKVDNSNNSGDILFGFDDEVSFHQLYLNINENGDLIKDKIGVGLYPYQIKCPIEETVGKMLMDYIINRLKYKGLDKLEDSFCRVLL